MYVFIGKWKITFFVIEQNLCDLEVSGRMTDTPI